MITIALSSIMLNKANIWDDLKKSLIFNLNKHIKNKNQEVIVGVNINTNGKKV